VVQKARESQRQTERQEEEVDLPSAFLLSPHGGLDALTVPAETQIGAYEPHKCNARQLSLMSVAAPFSLIGC
jgi:hypothetical protein